MNEILKVENLCNDIADCFAALANYEKARMHCDARLMNYHLGCLDEQLQQALTELENILPLFSSSGLQRFVNNVPQILATQSALLVWFGPRP